MELILRQGNVLDARADALILPVDGAARGMAGNIARQLERRFGEAWEELEGEVAFPVALGTCAHVAAPAGLPIRHVFFASILDHLENDHAGGYVRSALEHACVRSEQLGLATVATPLLRGGWRLSAAGAFRAMLDAVDARRDSALRLELYSLDPEHHAYLVELGRSFGLRAPP